MMTRDEEYERLKQDLSDKEDELAHIEDQIRLGYANEEEEDHYMNELQNEIMYIEACMRDYDNTDD